MAVNQDKTLSQRIYLPRVPESRPGVRPSEIQTWVSSLLMPFLREFIRSVENDAFAVHQRVNELTDIGDSLASSATIEVTHRTHEVTGGADIEKIEAEDGFRGFLYLINQGSWSLVQIPPPGGNIAVSFTPATNQLVVLVYDVHDDLWYPAGVGSGGGPSGGFALRGETQLVGTKNGTNKVFDLPGGDSFWLDVNGKVTGGVLVWKSNIISPTATVSPGDFEYQLVGASSILLGTAPESGDYLAFTSLVVTA